MELGWGAVVQMWPVVMLFRQLIALDFVLCYALGVETTMLCLNVRRAEMLSVGRNTFELGQRCRDLGRSWSIGGIEDDRRDRE